MKNIAIHKMAEGSCGIISVGVITQSFKKRLTLTDAVERNVSGKFGYSTGCVREFGGIEGKPDLLALQRDEVVITNRLNIASGNTLQRNLIFTV